MTLKDKSVVEHVRFVIKNGEALRQQTLVSRGLSAGPAAGLDPCKGERESL